MIETDTAQAKRCLLFAAGFGHNDDGLGAVEHGACPSGVLTAETNIDAAGQVALGVFGGVADVENLRAGIAQTQHFGEIDGWRLRSRLRDPGWRRSRVLRMAS